MENYKYKMIFAGDISPLENEKLASHISTANLKNLLPIFPESIDLNKNKDLIGCVFNAAVAGRCNKNGDAITNKSALNIAKHFNYKYVNIGHKTDIIKGVIVNVGYSKFGTNEVLTEEEASKLEEPFNIVLAFVLWKPSLSSEFIEKLESSINPESKEYHSISGSWELFFKDYDIGVGTANINESNIITSQSEKSEYESILSANGGTGQKDDKMVYRIIKGESKDDFLIPAGVGLVRKPAADVEGLEIIKANKPTAKSMTCPSCGEDSEMEDMEDVDDDEDKSCGKCGKTSKMKAWKGNKSNSSVNISQIISKLIDLDNRITITATQLQENICKHFTETKNSVINDKDNLNKIMDLKITQISDITDEALKQCSASTIIDFINDKVKEADEKFKIEREELSKLKVEKDELQTNLAKITDEINKLKNESAKREAKNTFDQRMSYFDDTYELSKEERQAIAEDIAVDKNVSDEIFAGIKNKYDIFLKDRSKAAIQAKKEAEKSNASANNDDALKQAAKNADDASKALPNTQAGDVSFKDKYKEGFDVKKCLIIKE